MAAHFKNGWYKATLPRRYFAVIIDAFILGFVNSLVSVSFAFVDKDYQVFSIFVSLLLQILYPVITVWKNGATFGKQILGLRIIGVDGKPPTLVQAILRETIGKFISSIVLGLGYLWALWDKDWQAWHDKIAHTYVVTKTPNSGKHSKWLIALIVLLVILPFGIAILVAALLVAVNPAKQITKARDFQRFYDVFTVAQSINMRVADETDPRVLCNGKALSCESSSDNVGAESTDGSGWVKIDLTGFIAQLPKDPQSDRAYRYCANKGGWEVNVQFDTEKAELTQLLRKQKFAAEMPNLNLDDNGDDPNLFELGTNLTACP